MLKHPPLRLEQSFFDLVQIEAIKGYDRGEYETNQPELLDVEVNLASLKEPAKQWEVRLEVRLKPDEELPLPPYRLDLRGFGYFAVPNGDEDAETARMVAVNGASILYSSMREYVMMVTSRGPWGSVTLPTISFTSLTVEARGDGETDVGSTD
ncbi:MAG: protein-export chaperone SecB [Thermoleophilia bacterium]